MDENIKIDEKLRDDIISVAYGDASRKTRKRVAEIIKENKAAAKLFAQYSETAQAVRDLKPEECPDALINNVLVSQKIGKAKRSFIYDWFTILYSKPAFTAAAGFAVVLVIAATLLFKETGSRYNGYTETQVEQASVEAKMALNIVGRFFAESKAVIKETILVDKIGQPVQKGIDELNKLFITGGKNEKLIN